MENNTYNILFLCTGNSARSIMAEGLITVLGHGRFKGYSAGSQPTGKVNPFAIERLQEIGYPVDDLRSKPWDEFAMPGSPQMDFIITVCDSAAGELCPVWPGHPITAHWGFLDPAAVEGTDEEKRDAFRKIFGQIRTRVQLFLELPVGKLDAMSLHKEMRNIGKLESTA